jgi:hypothetical protein
MAFDGIPLTGLWWNEGKDGRKYLRGSLGKATVFIFENKYKEASNHPDMNLYLAPSKKKEEGDYRDSEPPVGQQDIADNPPASDTGNDDIPF